LAVSFRPVVVNLLLRVAHHHERDRLGERELRSAVERRELLSIDLKAAVSTDPGFPGPASGYRDMFRTFEFLKTEQ
jgi:hypothetical protein